MLLLSALIETARDLNDPGAVNTEYAAGQTQLITAACALRGDRAGELVYLAVTHQITVLEFLDRLWPPPPAAVTWQDTLDTAEHAVLGRHEAHVWPAGPGAAWCVYDMDGTRTPVREGHAETPGQAKDQAAAALREAQR